MDVKNKCDCCGGAIDRDSIGLTLKLFGTDCKERYCFNCIAKKMHCTETRLQELLEYFKKTKCALF